MYPREFSFKRWAFPLRAQQLTAEVEVALPCQASAQWGFRELPRLAPLCPRFSGPPPALPAGAPSSSRMPLPSPHLAAFFPSFGTQLLLRRKRSRLDLPCPWENPVSH